MGAINPRGVWVPAAGDGLLEAWQTMSEQLGTFLPVASVAAAASALDLAQSAGMGATTSKPMLFLVGSGVQKIAYTADGSKTSGKWNLAPLNEVQVTENSYAAGVHASLAQFQWSAMTSSDLPAAPYDRVVSATGYAFGRVTQGRINLGLQIGGSSDRAEARFDSSGDDGTATVTNSGIVPANTAPAIRLGVVGDHPTMNSSITLGSHSKLSRLKVIAYPISMTA